MTCEIGQNRRSISNTGRSGLYYHAQDNGHLESAIILLLTTFSPVKADLGPLSAALIYRSFAYDTIYIG